MEKYIKNITLQVMMLLGIMVIIINPVQAVTIVNSASSQSSTGGQVVKSGAAGQDGASGKNGQDGANGQNGADGVSGNKLVTEDLVTETSVVSIVDGEAITYSYQKSQTNQDDVTKTTATVHVTDQDSSDGLPNLVTEEEVMVEDMIVLTSRQPTYLEVIFTSLRNLIVSYVSSMFSR